MKRAFKVLAFCLLLFTMAACQTKEERVINKTNKLAETVDQKADAYTDAEWDKLIFDFENLQKQAAECDFNKDQLKEFAKAEAKLTAAIAKHGAKKLGNKLNDLLEEGKEVVGSILDGLKEGFGDGEDADAETETPTEE